MYVLYETSSTSISALLLVSFSFFFFFLCLEILQMFVIIRYHEVSFLAA